MKPKRVVIGYIRVSSEEQAKSGLSLENQEKQIHAQATLRELTVDRIVRDGGESAKNLNRPGITSILEEVQAGKVSHLIVYKLDRLTRSLVDLGNLLALFDKHSVSLMSVQETLDTATANGRMLVNLLGMIAQWEREAIAERVRAAFAVKRSRNEKLGGIVPYGYRVSMENGRKMLTEDPEEAKVLGGILEARGEGRGYADIAAGLNQMGIKSRSGGLWYASTVRSIVQRAEKDRGNT